jgi:addiction module antitoxin, relB/dinJ family
MEADIMATTNLNIRTEKEIKDQAEAIFSELGLNMTTAINLFLRTTIRENGIPFNLKLEAPNHTTIEAIEEGRRLAYDTSVKGYTDIEALKEALDI